jgi:hypothetical protein
MAENDFDKASRYLAKLDPPAFLSWALGGSGFREWIDTRGLPFPGDPERTGDTVAWWAEPDTGRPWAVAVEFQTEPDPDMFGRLLEYLGGLWRTARPDRERGSRFHVGAVVLNLSGTGTASREMRLPGTGLVTHLGVVERNLASESAADLLGAIERGEHGRALLGWIPLMRGADDRGIIDRWKLAAEAEPNDRTRSELGGLAKVFAQVADRWKLWNDALREWNVKRSIAADEWRAEGRQTMLLDLLRGYFGEPPEDLVSKIEQTTDAATLRQWLLLAGRAADLAAFRAQAGI